LLQQKTKGKEAFFQPEAIQITIHFPNEVEATALMPSVG
jgi:hypothetical protein